MNPLQRLPNPLVALCAIIQSEMGLEDDQCYIYNSKFQIPTDQRLYVAVGVGGIKPYSNISVNESVAPALDGGMTETLKTNVNCTVDINILSKSDEALLRKEEVFLALGSQFSKQVQQAQSMWIAKLPQSVQNLSELEPTAIPYRFRFALSVHYLVKKQKRISYYSQFPDSLITEA